MPCQHHKNALIEAAASGSHPQGELRAHLDVCLDCRAAFEREQSLFASINTGLHVTANAEVPASLLPRVRARLDEEIAPQRRWIQPMIFATASVALAFVIFLFARPHHASPDSQAKQTPQLPVSETPVTDDRHPHSGRPRKSRKPKMVRKRRCGRPPSKCRSSSPNWKATRRSRVSRTPFISTRPTRPIGNLVASSSYELEVACRYIRAALREA